MAAATPTVAEAPSERADWLSKVIKMASSSTSDRLDEESMKTVLEIVLDNPLKSNIICTMQTDEVKVWSTDTHLIMSARVP